MKAQRSFGGTLLMVRLHKLGHIPSAVHCSEILMEHGAPVLVVEFGPPSEMKSEGPHAIPTRRFSLRFASLFPRVLQPVLVLVGTFFWLCFRFLIEGRPKLMVAHGIQEQCLTYCLGVIFNIPYAVHIHEVYEPSKMTGLNRFILRLEGRALRSAAFLICSERTRAEIYKERYCLRNPLFIVPNCCRLRAKGKALDLRAILGLPPESKLMAYMGGIGAVNLIKEAIEALAEVSNLCFLIWGWGADDYLALLQSVTRELGLQRRVLFLGHCPNKWAHLEACDISYCVYAPLELRTRYVATASNKLMEAMAAGLAVISSAEEDFRSIVEPNDIGVVAKSPDRPGLATAMRALTTDDELLRRQRANARNLHETKYNYEAVFENARKKYLSYV